MSRVMARLRRRQPPQHFARPSFWIFQALHYCPTLIATHLSIVFLRVIQSSILGQSSHDLLHIGRQFSPPRKTMTKDFSIMAFVSGLVGFSRDRKDKRRTYGWIHIMELIVYEGWKRWKGCLRQSSSIVNDSSRRRSDDKCSNDEFYTSACEAIRALSQRHHGVRGREKGRNAER